MSMSALASKPGIPRPASRLRFPLALGRPEERAPDFEAVYSEHFDFVWRTVRGLGVPPAFLDDVAQDVFLIVHRKLPTYEAAGSLRSWLFGIARRVCKDHRRASQRRGPHVDLDERSPAHTDDPHGLAASREALAVVERFSAALDEEHRAIFFLALVEGLPVSEVAEALQLNPNTTYSRVRVLRRDLARLLETEAPPLGDSP